MFFLALKPRLRRGLNTGRSCAHDWKYLGPETPNKNTNALEIKHGRGSNYNRLQNPIILFGDLVVHCPHVHYQQCGSVESPRG